MDLLEYTLYNERDFFLPNDRYIEMMYVKFPQEIDRFHFTIKSLNGFSTIVDGDNAQITQILANKIYGLKEIYVGDDKYIPCFSFCRINDGLVEFEKGANIINGNADTNIYIKFGSRNKYKLRWCHYYSRMMIPCAIKYIMVNCYCPKMDIQLGQLYVNQNIVDYSILYNHDSHFLDGTHLYTNFLIELTDAVHLQTIRMTDFDNHKFDYNCYY